MTNPATSNRLMKRVEVEDATGLASSSIYEVMHATDHDVRFPHPVKIGNRSRWVESEIHDWIERQKDRTRRLPA